MGDWRRPRTGLTKHERGIPLDLFRRIVADAGLTVERETLTTFPLLPRVLERIGIRPYNSPVLTALDGVLCRVSAFNTRYHRTSVLHKLAPAQVAFVLRKP